MLQSINFGIFPPLPHDKLCLRHFSNFNRSSTLPIKHLPSHPDNTTGNQLLDLHPDTGVLHVLLKSGGIILGLLKDALHDRILENRHDLTKGVSK